MTTPRCFVSIAVWRRCSLSLLIISLPLGFARAVDSIPNSDRIRSTFQDIECEYSPGQEQLAKLLAERLALRNRDMAGVLLEKQAASPMVPLSPEEMRANRAVYLERITSLLGMAEPTSLQEECFDAFLDNYQLTMTLYEEMRGMGDTARVVKRFAVWDRAELVRRLEAHQKVPGFEYDPVTKQGSVSYGSNYSLKDEKLKDLAERRKSLRLSYILSVSQKGGVATYRGRVAPKNDSKKTAAAKDQSASEKNIVEATKTEWLPIIIPADLATLPAEELAQKLWDGNGDRSLVKLLKSIAEMYDSLPRTDPHLAYLVLHETTELGIVDHYFSGTDRRWFCDGVANYVPWRVMRDLHGIALATSVYNLPDQLARYASFSGKADLRKWPAVENQSEEDQYSELDRARYAFAANAVFLMNQRAGEDVLPKLFVEIGRTKPENISIKTVESAWKKVTRTKLETVLAAAVQPVPHSKAIEVRKSD